MKNLFALVGAGTIAFAGLGWYLDWYKLSRIPSTSGTQTVRFDVHPEKTYDDVRRAIERGGETIGNFRDGGNSAQSPPKPSTAGPASQFFSPTSATTPAQ